MKPQILKNLGLISFFEEKNVTRTKSELISRRRREHISHEVNLSHISASKFARGQPKSSLRLVDILVAADFL